MVLQRRVFWLFRTVTSMVSDVHPDDEAAEYASPCLPQIISRLFIEFQSDAVHEPRETEKNACDLINVIQNALLFPPQTLSCNIQSFIDVWSRP